MQLRVDPSAERALSETEQASLRNDPSYIITVLSICNIILSMGNLFKRFGFVHINITVSIGPAFSVLSAELIGNQNRRVSV